MSAEINLTPVPEDGSERACEVCELCEEEGPPYFELCVVSTIDDAASVWFCRSCLLKLKKKVLSL